MSPENVPNEVVEKAARALADNHCVGDDAATDARHALAAVFNEIWGGGYAAAVRDVDLMGARAHAWDEAVAMCCEFLGVPNVNWPNKYRETGGAS